MNKENGKKSQDRRPGVFVRLNEVQKLRLESESFLLNWSIPRILRENYFKRMPTKVTFDKEGENKFLTMFNRIGNNINQLTRVANSGEKVSHADLTPIRNQLKLLYNYVMRTDGLLKDSSK